MADKSLTIFVSYSHRDKKYLQELVDAFRPFTQLVMAPATERLRVSTATDQDIHAGADWNASILNQINGCDVALALVSQHFLSSTFICNVEIPTILNLKERKGLRVYWLPLSASSVEQVAPELHRLQALSDPGSPLASYGKKSREQKLVAIANSLVSGLDTGGALNQSKYSGAGRFGLTLSRPFLLRDELRPPRFVILSANHHEVELPFTLPRLMGLADLPKTAANLESWRRTCSALDDIYRRLRDVHLCLQGLVNALDQAHGRSDDAMPVAAEWQTHVARLLAIMRPAISVSESTCRGLGQAVAGSEPFRYVGHLRDCARALQAGALHPLEEPDALGHFKSTARLAGILCGWLLQVMEFSQHVLETQGATDV